MKTEVQIFSCGMCTVCAGPPSHPIPFVPDIHYKSEEIIWGVFTTCCCEADGVQPPYVSWLKAAGKKQWRQVWKPCPQNWAGLWLEQQNALSCSGASNQDGARVKENCGTASSGRTKHTEWDIALWMCHRICNTITTAKGMYLSRYSTITTVRE